MNTLKRRFTSRAFNAGALICPQGQAEAHIKALPETRKPRSVSRLGEAGMLYVSSEPDSRRYPKPVIIGHAMEPHPGPGPVWDESWVLDSPARLAVYDLTAREYGLVTPKAGEYLCRSRLISGSERPGDPYYTPEGWLLEITMLDGRGQPVPDRWWDFLDDEWLPLNRHS